MINIQMLDKTEIVYDITVEDNHNFYANNILVHNCTEIVLPSRASANINEELVTKEDSKSEIIKRYDAGEIALCNLSSINLERWYYLNDEEKIELVSTLVRGLDNTIDIATYPVKEGKHSNIMYRYLGIGVLNFVNYLALKHIVIDTQEALEETDALFDELSYMVITSSMELAKEKGRFPKFHETEWSQGVLPIHKANEKAMGLTKYKPNMDKWDALSNDIMKYGIRNATLLAIAPTACQTKYSKIQTNEGTLSLETIMESRGIDHSSIENEGAQGWFVFDNCLSIPTRFGNKEVSRIWYNGKQPTKKIEFEDGNMYEFTLNHKLLVNDGNREYWCQVGNLKEGMDIVSL
jgi:ribonucleotide reductase alpha subunit